MGTQTSNGKISFILAGLLLAILMASMDNTIVATAMGTIVGKLGGFDKFIWVTSAYMIAGMAGMPVFGKLSDMYGRKRFFLFGMIVFLIGSILCGTAQSIVQLSIYRAIQGIGGGALMPITFTIIFDVVPPEQRGKTTGLFGATFGLSSIFGPLLGSYITDYIDWRWIFYINLPIGLLSLLFILIYYKESHAHSKQKIDWLGAATLVAAVVCLMFGLEFGGHKYGWSSPQMIGLFTGFAVLTIAFLWAEAKAKEPIISYRMFQNRLFRASVLIGLFYGVAFIVATVYIPIFVQGVRGGSATSSGMLLLPMMLGVVASSQIGAIWSVKFGYRNVMLVFGFIFLLGIASLGTLSMSTPSWLITVYMIITGLGIGASFSVLSMAAIQNLSPMQRGSANSTMSFVRELGMAIGVTVYGIVQRNDFSARMAGTAYGTGQPAGGIPNDPRVLLSPEGRAAIPAPLLEKITGALSGSITYTFLWALLPTVLVLCCILMLSNEKMGSEEPVKQAAA